MLSWATTTESLCVHSADWVVWEIMAASSKSLFFSSRWLKISESQWMLLNLATLEKAGDLVWMCQQWARNSQANERLILIFNMIEITCKVLYNVDVCLVWKLTYWFLIFQHAKLIFVFFRRTSLPGVYWRRWAWHRIYWVLEALGTTTAFGEGFDFIRVCLGGGGSKMASKRAHRIEA